MTVTTLDTSVSPLPGAQGGTGVVNTNKTFTLGANTSISNAGIITSPAKIFFNVSTNGNVNNVTGDGTNYTIIHDQVNFDVGSHYNNTTGIYTIPVTGTWWFYIQIGLLNITSGHTAGSGNLHSTNIGNLSNFFLNNPYNYADNGGAMVISGSTSYNFTAGDTLNINVVVYNSTKTVGIFSTANACVWSGFLLA